jgi:hypothetical protein
MDLHIAVTDSEGSVVEFDKGGLQQHRTGMWCQCLVVDGAARPWREHWDTTLKAMTAQECWSPERYVLSMIQLIAVNYVIVSVTGL